MDQFWEFYKNMSEVHFPFKAFGLSHILLLLISVCFIFGLYRYYCHCHYARKITIQKILGIYFLLEETIYMLWLCLQCHENLFLEAIPLQLCSMSSYAAFFLLFTNNKQLKFFVGLMGIFGAMIALAYPANIDSIYPIFSYRTINFFMQHASLVVFGMMQFENRELFKKHYFMKNLIIVCGLFFFCHIFNLIFDTAFMFVEMPPTVSIIHILYEITGPYFFFISFISIFALLITTFYLILKQLYFMRRDA